MAKGKPSASVLAPNTVTVRVPIAFRRRGARKAVFSPDGSPAFAPACVRTDNALINALARAHRWKKLLETGEYSSLTDLAAAERIDKSYLSKVLRLTLLAPVIVDAILDDRAESLKVASVIANFPLQWNKQKLVLASRASTSEQRRSDPGLPPMPCTLDTESTAPSAAIPPGTFPLPSSDAGFTS